MIKDNIKKYFFELNITLLVCTMLLILIGLVAIYSATFSGIKFYFIKQLIWYFLGLIFMFIIFNINYNLIIQAANYFYILFILILIIVLVLGKEIMGAQRWLKLGWFQIQPSEFMKIIIPITIIRFILIKQNKAFTTANLLKIFFIVFLPMLLILKQPDLGTAILLLPLVFIILFIGNIKIKKLIIILFILLSLLPLSYFMLKDYQKQRLYVFFNPEIDKLGAGYNVIQSQIAVGSGKFLGKGWLRGTQSQLNYIPVKYTDFIFAVISEEFGFLGSFIILLIYFILIMECFKIVNLCKFAGGKMLGAALTSIILFQVFINIGMTIGIMPVTGITLPLLSYGGSSTLVILISLGILQNIYKEYVKVEK